MVGAAGPPSRSSASAEGLAAVHERIERAGGGPDVVVLPVTKGFGPDAIEAAVAAGCSVSARTMPRSCWPSCRRRGPPPQVHFIGQLQSRRCGT